MADERDLPAVPERPDARDVPRVGVDEWVAQVEERRIRRRGLVGLVERAWRWSPEPARLAVFVAVAASLPLFLSSGNLYRYGLFTLVYALLALGLNTVVGFAGLLDLGYVAFYGFGAYSYALLSSDHYDIHWPAEASIPVIMVASALLGLLLGLPSRRLLGDYLAIVTLFFGQAFVVFVNNANPRGLTGGANGIPNVDPLSVFGFELTTTRDYFYFTLAAFTVVMAGLYFATKSRTGRAWQALREDPLAAEAMGMPVNRLKLLAFAFGAAIAGLAGCIFAAVITGAYPGNFDISLVILIYAVVILGGMGSLAGVVIGAIVINVAYEFLNPAADQLDQARLLFYGIVVVALVTKLRPWPRAAAALAGTVVFGLAAHEAVERAWPSATRGEVIDAGFLENPIASWVVVAADPGTLGDFAYIGLVVAIVLVSRMRGWWRTLAVIPTLYLVAVVWENLLVHQPAVTRLILFGALLIALMMAHPQGLLGTTRVEVV
ncbi:MAG: branched-chain amino acid ABC transporter permease [Actinomycetota bacterium]|nr:branched-chain amino acid ABC transporter permease [Actinomycetota bacterium]